MNSLLRALFLLVILAVGAEAAAPTISDPTATGTGNGTVRLSARINAGGQLTTVVFSFGRTTLYGSTLPAEAPATATAQVVSVNLTGLVGGATYNYQVSASNADGSATSTSNQTFVVTAFKPTLTLIPVLHAADGSVTMRATVTANGTAGTAFFQYGVDPANGGTEVPAEQNPILATAVDTTISAKIPGPFVAGLSFRVIFRDAAGTIVSTSAVARTNTRPEASADAYTLTDLEPLTLDVLENDSDREGDLFTINSVSKPRFGTAVVNAAGTEIVYTPNQTLFAVDTFRYTIKETVFGATSTATVTIRPLRATLAGTHGGLVRNSAGKEIGYFRITSTALGSFTGSVVIDGKSYPLSGSFGADGSFAGVVSRDGDLLAVRLSTELGENGTTIRADFGDGKYSANVEFTEEEAATRGPLAGRYTVELPGSGSSGGDGLGSDGTSTPSALPEGNGWAALKVGEDGSVRVKGRLPDGRSFSTRGTLGVGPDGPLITFFDDPDDTRVIGSFAVGDTVTGSLRVDRSSSNDDVFPAGYDATLTASGARYIAPGDNRDLIPGTRRLTIAFSGGELPTSFSRNLEVTGRNKFRVLDGGDEDLVVKVDKSSGRLQTKMTIERGGPRLKGTGVIVQGTTDGAGGSGGGVFQGRDRPGRFQITPGATVAPATPRPSTPNPVPTPGATPIVLDLQR